MRTLLTIMVSDNDQEIFVYSGTGETYEGLIMVKTPNDSATVGDYVTSVIDNLIDGE
jgi:hypothetical protein